MNSGAIMPTQSPQDISTVKMPNLGHPMTIEPEAARVVVTVAGRVVADTRNALTLREANYPPAVYIPREDVDMAQLERSEHITYCPHKGDCNYYSIPGGGQRSMNAAWTYESPYDAVMKVKDYLAFYPDRVDSFVLRPDAADSA
jgi:uncharacterized protein (DUF427 family)